MTRDEILAYAHRDWEAVAAAKLADWALRKHTMTAEQAIASASALRQGVTSRRPDWPSDAERAEDLATHLELVRRLRLVDPRSCR